MQWRSRAPSQIVLITKPTRNVGSAGDNTHLEIPEQAAGGGIWGEVNRNDMCMKK